MPNSENEIREIFEKLRSLESRIDSIEFMVNKGGIQVEDPVLSPSRGSDETELSLSSTQDNDSIFESKIVEYGLAWFGSIVLLFGVIFLIVYLKGLGYHIAASVIGYIVTGIVFSVSYLLRKAFSHLVYVLNFTGFLLTYYITLRLHFFTSEPLIPNTGLIMILLSIIIGMQFYYAIIKKSEFLAGIGLVMILLIAVFSDQTHISLIINTLAAAISLVLFTRYNWWRLLLMSVFLVYLLHLLWFLSNPIMGHPLKAVEAHQHNLIY